jgi:hypothetical protein
MRNYKLPLTTAIVLAALSVPFTASAADSVTSNDSLSHPPYRPWTLSLDAGTTGLGGSISWRFADHWGVRSGLDYFEYSDSGLAIKALKYDATVRIMSEPLTLDIYPWEKHSFHVSVGVQFNQNRLTGVGDDTGTILPPARAGTLELSIEQQPVNPYLSIGGTLLYFDKAHHWALGGELGVAYTGDPKVSLARTGPPAPLLDAAVKIEEGRIVDYAEQFQWWPVLKLTVSYSF